MKFIYKNNVYDVDVVASVEQLRRPLADRDGGEPLTHVMTFKPWFIQHESQKKGKFLTEAEALDICKVLMEPDYRHTIIEYRKTNGYETENDKRETHGRDLSCSSAGSGSDVPIPSVRESDSSPWEEQRPGN